MLKELITFFDSYKKPLIHVDLGGHILKEEHKSPYVIHHSLNLWQTAYASGVYAANTYGKNAALAISFYDGGYHLTESFVRGFTENGGNIVYNYVSPMDYKSETFETLIQGLEASKPDVVFSLFSHKEAEKVFETLSQSKQTQEIPFLAIPLMTDEVTHTKNYQLQSVSSIASWAFNEETIAMKSFLSDYKILYEDNPNIISLLGFEVGLTITACTSEEHSFPVKISEYLTSKIIETPRGLLTYNSFNESQVPHFKIRKFNFLTTNYQNTVIDSIDALVFENLYQKFEELPFSGWKNPYICT